MAVKLYIVRHGQPANQEPGYSGGPNPGLSRLGHEQAQRTARQLAQWGIDVLYSSPYQRAIETAQPIQKKLGVPWHLWPALSETGRRDWPKIRQAQSAGMDRDLDPHAPSSHEVARERPHFPPVSKLVQQYPETEASQPFPWPDDWHIPLKGETREAAYARALQCIQALNARHQDDSRLALVCHGAFGSVLLTVLSGGPPCDHNRFGFAHAAIARVDLFKDGRTMFELVDYIGHLLPDCVTEGPNF